MKIEFRPYKSRAGETNNAPHPAIKSLPAWFSKMPRFINEEKKFRFFPDGTMNPTIKWCNPFLDSLGAGYILRTEYDLYVEKQNGELNFSWRAGENDLITLHKKQQISKEMVPAGFSEQPYKFRGDWSIKTPKGYSALFVHPLNRTDLPFHTLSGFVDTDDYKMPVSFPFLMQKDFEGIIPAGTPIVQVIPIKRESWTHEINPYSELLNNKESAVFLATIYRAYKNLFWKRKDYR
jgi:hypothetical protein